MPNHQPDDGLRRSDPDTDGTSLVAGESGAGPAPERAVTDMLAVDATKVIMVGTALFFLAFLALLACWSWIDRTDRESWLWTALAGWVLGLAALPLVRKHSAEGRLG